MPKEVVVTHEGYKKLEQELDNLRTVKRKEVADKIKVARGYGDLRKNAEYDAAKEDRRLWKPALRTLEATLKVARIIDDNDLSAGYCLHRYAGQDPCCRRRRGTKRRV